MKAAIQYVRVIFGVLKSISGIKIREREKKKKKNNSEQTVNRQFSSIDKF